MKLNNLLHSFSANKPMTDTAISNKTGKIALPINKPDTKAVNLLASQIASEQKDTHIYKPISPQTVQTTEPTPDELSFFIKFDKDKKARPRIPESVLANPKPKEATEKYLKDVVSKYYVYIKDIEDQSAKIDDQTGQKIPTKSPEQIAQLKKERATDTQSFLNDFNKEYEKTLESVNKEAKKNPMTPEQIEVNATTKTIQRWNSKNLYGDRKADEKNKADDKQQVFVKGKDDINEIELNDLNQGQTGDCFILAAIGSVAKQHPEKIKNLITDNKDGTFNVKIYKPDLLGNYVETTQKVDGKLIGDGHAKYGDVEKIDGKEKKESWVVLIEKAYIQANGSYKDVSKGGKTNDVLSALLGKDVDVSKDYKTGDLAGLLATGKAVVMNTPKLDSITDTKVRDKFENTYKLVETHSYVLSEIKKNKEGKDIAVLYNPHGENHAEVLLSDLKELFPFLVSEK